MLTRTELLRRLKLELGPHIWNLCTDVMIDEAIHESLLLYSEFYPQLYKIRVTKDMAVSWTDEKGRTVRYGKYLLPETYPQTNEKIHYIGIFSYNIFGNDTSDAYSGRGNLMLDTLSKIALSQLPNSRSPFTLSFEQPNIISLDPSASYAFMQSIMLTMKVVKRLDQVQYTMARHFKDLFIAWVKKILYNYYKHSKGDQTVAGVEIDLLLDDYSSADEDIDKKIELFSNDYYKNPELYDNINHFNHK